MQVKAEPVDVSFEDMHTAPSTSTTGCKRQRVTFDGVEVPTLRSLRRRVDLKSDHDTGTVVVSKEIEAKVKGLKNVRPICSMLIPLCWLSLMHPCSA